MITLDNIIANTDSYKLSHWNQYPPGTEYVYAYVESRGGEYNKTVFFGLQMFIRQMEYATITHKMIDEAEQLVTAHGLPFNRAGWEYIVDKCNGKLPVRIDAVPEGTVLPTHNVLATIVNTDPNCYWLPSYLETALLRAIWYPTTVATQSYDIKRYILNALEETSDDPEGQIGFKLHDFGARGVSSLESAAIGGLAHLVNFMGTDTISALVAAQMYYSANGAVGFSIPAMEHSTVTSWGKENEARAFDNMLDHYAKPGALLACVSDSYSLYNAVENIWGEELKQKVIDSGAIVVVRPDSGDPVQNPLWTIEKLAEKAGYTVNSKGYKVLNHFRVIQGDGMNPGSIRHLVDVLKNKGWSIDNIAFGMGGGLLQHINRDTLKFAMKTSAICINGEWRDVYKEPATDTAKKSKKGRMVLLLEDDNYVTRTVDNPEDYRNQNQLVPVYDYNANDRTTQLRYWNFDEIRNRAK